MRKIIAAINMTIDGFCDHTAGLPDAEIHEHYKELIDNSDAILYGRITFELMHFWPTLLKNPSGDKAMDDFALAIDRIPKIVFSKTLKDLSWKSATLSNITPEEVVKEFKQKPGRDILVGSRSLIIHLMKLNLVEELQLCIHPLVVGNGLPLFEKIKDRMIFKLIKTKTFKGGAVTHYYQPTIDNE